MAQKLIQTQEQKLAQMQRLSQQQMLLVHLLEMPLTELEESVNAELDDNPALEKGREEDEMYDTSEGSDSLDNDSEEEYEQEERQEALDSALETMGADDELPLPSSYVSNKDNADYEEMVWGDNTSFYDKLNEQMGIMELSEQEQLIMEYLIGSLDDDGLLRKDLDNICDELAIYHNIDVPVKTIENVLYKLQTMDPAGIGGRSLQECLLLQIQRKRTDDTEEGIDPYQRLHNAMEDVIKNHFDDFTKNHWDKIKQNMQLNDTQIETLQKELRKLNPKPGAALAETEGRSTQQITPDFIVDTSDDGIVTFTLNNGNIPELKVSPSFVEMVDAYNANNNNMNRRDKEALLYAKEKLDKAQGFINAVKQRQQTLILTMKAIIEWQHDFFVDGDEADMKPMILEDIAKKTNLDKSTISRVSNIKYAQTKWGTFPLRFFFSDKYTRDDGQEVSIRKIKIALKELINAEDKTAPLSDDSLAKELKQKGFPIARRTVAKYREQLGFAIARLRKQ